MIKIFATGNLGADPQLKDVNGRQVCTFPVAVRTAKRDKDTNAFVTEWYNVSVWGKAAESCSTYLHKGSRVVLSGALSHRSYTAKDGTNRVANEITCDSVGGVEFQSSPPANGEQPNRPTENQEFPEMDDDELPF